MGSAKRKTAGRKKLSLGKQTVKDLAPGRAKNAKGGYIRTAICHYGGGYVTGVWVPPDGAP